MHIILVHGWKGGSDFGWFPWLRRELASAGHMVDALVLPRPIWPDRLTWVDYISHAIQGPDTILVGHSLGCPSILLALQEYEGDPVFRTVLVSGFARPFPFPLVNAWFGDAKIDMDSVRRKSRSWAVLHTKTDLLVPFREGEWMAERLGVSLTEVMSHGGHLAPEDGALEVPEILSAVLHS
jgi:predicted alpha/beta hydrolase family esterase